MRRSPALLMVVLLGFAFLYLPIVSLIIYSFNESRLVTVWGGFSFKWYASLLHDRQLIEAAGRSLGIGALSATAATVLGLMAAYALRRYGPYPGRGLLAGLLTGPLVMPEVVTGLSLLLLFVALETAIGWPSGRGLTTIVIAHTTFGMAYAAVVIEARLGRFDRSLEEAAADLGATPVRVFLDVTLPMIAPALVAAWLLAFTLSFDDLVVASFTSGPGASTLPMVVFSKARLGVSPEVNALATVMIGVVAVGLVAAFFLAGRSQKTTSATRPGKLTR